MIYIIIYLIGYIVDSIEDKIEHDVLKQILSQSTPLIPEIEKAFDEGENRQWGVSYNENNPFDTIELKSLSKQDYISNLKLNV